ncbi:MAG TPA: translation initiation factor IF-3 [Candidatus Babeliales bacterium]|nr:translation initiation factor IF-3 [Candidatus Babeliales bacterium]
MKHEKSKLPLINERIFASRLQLITEAGENLGTVTRDQALAIARETGQDLVLISDGGTEGLPIAKVMDFGKTVYAKKKKLSESKKKQKVIKVKELKLRPKIGEHDFTTKLNQGIAFLKDGNRLKVTVQFRGRENTNRQELGGQMFARIDQALQSCPELPAGAVMSEKEAAMGQFWSRIYYLK